MARACNTCDFWHRGRSGEFAECRAMAPQHAVSGEGKPSRVWPVAFPLDWCGMWVERPNSLVVAESGDPAELLAWIKEWGVTQFRLTDVLQRAPSKFREMRAATEALEELARLEKLRRVQGMRRNQITWEVI